MTPPSHLYNDVPLIKHLSPLTRFLFQLRNALNAFFGGSVDQNQIKDFNVDALSNLDQTLYKIAYEVVVSLGYVGARIAILESDKRTLQARAYFIDPDLLEVSTTLSYEQRIEECERQVQLLELYLSNLSGKQVGLKAPSARIDIEDEASRNNLGVRAIKAQTGPQLVTDTDLFSLFVPVLSERIRPAVQDLQKRLGIMEVAAIPLVTEQSVHNVRTPQVIGNIFVASRRDISDYDKAKLIEFGRRATQAVFSDQILLQLKSFREGNASYPLSVGDSHIQRRKKHLNNLIAQHWENYHELEIQKAKYGIDTPLHIVNGLKDEMKEINRLKEELASIK